VDETRNEYTELERLRDDANKAEDELQELVEGKRHDLENDIQKIDEELADLEALCTALGCHQEFEAIVSTNGSR
jgi:predicted  nucleic acid-binding Zn-ribbon protein